MPRLLALLASASAPAAARFFAVPATVPASAHAAAALRPLPEGVCSDDAGEVRYFAFGSNLLRSKIDGRGRTEVLDCVPATAREHRLAFNLRMFPPLEPSMASIEASPGDACEGALFTLTRDGYEALWKSEGGTLDRPPYEEVQIPVHVDGRVVQAVTLRAAPWMRLTRDAPPSARYRDLIVAGAKELGLSDDYIEGLEALPVAAPSQALAAIVRAHGVVAVLVFKLSARLGAPWLRRVLVPLRSACYALLRARTTGRREESATLASRVLDVGSEVATAALLLPTAAVGALVRLALRLGGKPGWARFGPPVVPPPSQPEGATPAPRGREP